MDTKRRSLFHHRGQTLIGLLIALSLSSSLLLLSIKFFTQQLISRQQRFADLSLQQQVEQALHIMEKDIRRTGFVALKKNLQASNFTNFLNEYGKAWTIGEKHGEVAQSCFLFFYDLDHSGCLGGKNNRGQKDDKVTHCVINGINQMSNVEKELFGYRLSNGNLERRAEKQHPLLDHCHQNTCQRWMAKDQCTGSPFSWRGMLSPDIKITRLHFLPIQQGKAIEIQLSAILLKFPNRPYHSSALVELVNQ